jgi:hypothetical protein
VKPRSSKYLQLLEADLALERKRNEELHADVNFYRAKCERLEIALAANPEARREYAGATKTPAPKIDTTQFVETQARRLPFSELKRRWMQLTEAEQEKAVAEGSWNAETKEEANAGQ